ncbi:hypothetical protein EON80_18680 [bacterium]|nr:MAG: hypothetical protein EON80_18680 [bacterium]
MKYSLVLQFVGQEPISYDLLIEIEDALEKYLHGLAIVDGHDMGSDEANIFIFTDDPAAIFERSKFIVKSAGLLPVLSSAYRLVNGEQYFRLWPVDSSEAFIVT